MAIATAVQRGGFVYVYDDHGQVLSTLPTGSDPSDGLQGYTGSTVSVRRGGFVYIYNEKGMVISTVPSR